jgi:hypothetical protein
MQSANNLNYAWFEIITASTFILWFFGFLIYFIEPYPRDEDVI